MLIIGVLLTSAKRFTWLIQQHCHYIIMLYLTIILLKVIVFVVKIIIIIVSDDRLHNILRIYDDNAIRNNNSYCIRTKGRKNILT